ncbi:sensor histidine kinase [Luteolibacter sp. SL250]|uniref:sensor histidine kinase n=1 Tax=Luteolibacter sp. SL250 TaxID=2995170 RepID=UPI00226E58BA|nr:sensor histidine kinase [Luteolibacter sp. SL250]WAC20542.1 sensor histidine kinase [Luteolibacter sp. SL250]
MTFLRPIFWLSALSAVAVAQPLERRLAEIEKERASLPAVTAAEQTPARIGHHGFEADPAWVVIDFGRTVTPERIALFPARPPAGENSPPNGFPSAFDIEIDETPEFSASIEIADWKETSPGAGERLPFLILEGNRASGRFLRLNVSGFRDDGSGRKSFRLGEIVVMENGGNAALGRPITHSAALASARAWEGMNLVDGYFWCQPLQGPGTSPTEGYQTSPREDPEVNGSVWVEVDLGVRRPIDAVHLVPAAPREGITFHGYGFPTHFNVIADPGTEDETIILKENSPPFPAEALPNPGAAPVMKETQGINARRVRVVCDALWRQGSSRGGRSDYLFALSEIQCWHQGTNLAAGATVTVSDEVRGPLWSPEALTDGFSSSHPLLSWDAWLDGIERSEALRLQADEIRRKIAVREKEDAAAFGMRAAIIAGATIVLAGAVVAWQRRRSQRQQEELRERIARDLHDEIGASLSHLAMQGDLARQKLDRAELTSERLQNLSDSARETLDQMRDIVWLLSPKAGGDWQDLSLRLEAISRRLLEGTGHEVKVEGNPPAGKPEIGQARDLVAFLKESLTNARRHGKPAMILVTLQWEALLLLRIEDDGKGFDGKAAASSSGTGLRHLRERAEAMGADLEIDSNPGEGTRIRLNMPYHHS